MEQINRIEIRGNIGFLRINEFEDNQQMASFSVVTNYIYKGRDGSGVVETMWFNVVAWKKPQSLQDFSLLKKGAPVHVVGRMRDREYTANDGTVKHVTEVVASKVELVETDDQLQPCRLD